MNSFNSRAVNIANVPNHEWPVRPDSAPCYHCGEIINLPAYDGTHKCFTNRVKEVFDGSH